MAKNTVPIIIGAVVFGLLAIGLTLYSVMRGAAPAPQPQTIAAAQPAPVAAKHFIAMRPIYPRTVITNAMLREGTNSDGVPVTAITDLSDIVGRMANRTIAVGQTITADAVTLPIARVIPANIPVPVGLRAVAIWVDPNQTAAGLVDVGDRVDVIAIHELKAVEKDEYVTVGALEYTQGSTLAQDIEVLAVDRSIKKSEDQVTPAPATTGPNGQPAPTSTPTPVPAPTPAPAVNQPAQTAFIRVLLAVSPTAAQQLVAANRKGVLHITIRNPNTRERGTLVRSNQPPSRTVFLNTKARERQQKVDEDIRKRNWQIQDKIIEHQSKRWEASSNSNNATPLPSPDFSNSDPGKSPMVIMPSDNSKDVTIIRGTEKTRVVVPR